METAGEWAGAGARAGVANTWAGVGAEAKAAGWGSPGTSGPSAQTFPEIFSSNCDIASAGVVERSSRGLLW